MKQTLSSHCTAFAGDRRIATGTPGHVALKVKTLLETDPNIMPLIFDDASGEQVDFDLRGTPDQVLHRLAPQEEPAAEPAAEPRALFAGQRERFHELTAPWPADIRDHARKLAEVSFSPASGPQGKS